MTITALGALEFFLWAAATVSLLSFVGMLRGLKKLRDVSDLPENTQGDVSELSVVFAARDEARGIGAALTKLASIPGPTLEFVVVNDRSVDATGDLIRAQCARDARFRMVEISELPSGWLGKNHALQVGATLATKPWILFTDADVIHSAETLQKSLQHVRMRNLDFLSLLIDVRSPSTLVQIFIGFFAFSFTSFFRPWESANPKSKAAVGVGAFNLVKRETYFKHGGHTKIAMRPDDDVMLAKHLKAHGARLDTLTDVHGTSVEWYASLREAAHGLEKNTIAGLNYSFGLWGLALIATTGFFILAPLCGLLMLSPPGLATYGVSVVASLVGAARWQQKHIQVLAYPLGALFFVGIVARAGALTLLRQGIRWRGRFYSLRELKDPPPPSPLAFKVY